MLALRAESQSGIFGNSSTGTIQRGTVHELESLQEEQKVMSPPVQELPDSGAWQAQNLSLIAFPIDPQLNVDQHWWQDLTGTQPESSTKRISDRTDQGPCRNVVLGLAVDLLRIQWTVGPRATDFASVPGMLTVGSFLETRNWFLELMLRWLEICPAINRLAFAGRLFQPAEDPAGAYRMLRRYLPFADVNPPDSSDLLYRINRRRRSLSGIPELFVNRLSTWSVVQMNLQLTPLIPGAIPRQVQATQYACMVDLDINTAVEFTGELPRENVCQLFRELVDLGAEIAAQGDVP